MKKQKFIFYFLSFTWGIVLTLAGLIVAGVLLLAGKKPKKHGWCWYFEVGGRRWGGLNLGLIFLTGPYPLESTKDHEFGHAIQNCMYGPLMLFLVTIPSAIRYWYRELRYHRRGKTPKTDYDSIWFERQATIRGITTMSDIKHLVFLQK